MSEKNSNPDMVYSTVGYIRAAADNPAPTLYGEIWDNAGGRPGGGGVSAIADERLAESVFDGQLAESRIEDRCGDMWPDLVDHVGFDSYDGSIEVYFVRNAPADLAATEEQCDVLESWGFDAGWFNFSDGTEQRWCGKGLRNRMGGNMEGRIGSRRIVAHPKWSSIED